MYMLDDIKPARRRPDMAQQTITNNNSEAEAVLPTTSFMSAQSGEADNHDELPAPQPDAPHPKKGRGPKNWLAKWKGLSRNKKIIILSALAGLFIAAGLIWWFVLRSEPQQTQAPPKEETKQEEAAPAPTTKASPLTGVQVSPELAAYPVTGVMIENSPDARPQSGLYDAGVVYEAIAEGGITRFLALFQEARPTYIGPVRSVRPYYLDFLVPYDAPVAHAGGSGFALNEIKSQGIKDIDHGANGSTFTRVNSRFAPHNLYTSREALLSVHKAKGWNTSNFTGFVRKADKPSATPDAKLISLTISSTLYNPRFGYDPGSNSYLREEGGKPHMDEKAGKQINPKVVVVIITPHRYDGIYSVYGVIGSGQAYFFQDGTVTKGIWEKKDRKTQYKFGDANGSPLALNAGQTWVSLVTSANDIKYSP